MPGAGCLVRTYETKSCSLSLHELLSPCLTTDCSSSCLLTMSEDWHATCRLWHLSLDQLQRPQKKPQSVC